jgi:hypothetical protein
MYGSWYFDAKVFILLKHCVIYIRCLGIIYSVKTKLDASLDIFNSESKLFKASFPESYVVYFTLISSHVKLESFFSVLASVFFMLLTFTYS